MLLQHQEVSKHMTVNIKRQYSHSYSYNIAIARKTSKLQISSTEMKDMSVINSTLPCTVHMAWVR